MTPQQRRNQVQRSRRKPKAKSTKTQEGKTHGEEVSAHAFEQQAESSTMGETRGAIGGGFSPYFEFPFPMSEDTDPFLLAEEGDSDETLWDSVNGDELSMSLFPNVTHGPHVTDPSTVAPAASDPPSFLASDSFLARTSTPPNVPSTRQQEHEQPKPPSPTLQELIDWLNAQPDITETFDVASPTRDYAIESDVIALNDLPTSPGPSSPQAPIDSVLPHTASNAVEPVGRMQEAEQANSTCVWPQSPESKNRGEKKIE